MQFMPRQRIDLFGLLAFGGLVLACYAQLTFVELMRVGASVPQLTWLFSLGIVYSLLFGLSGALCDNRPPWVRGVYYAVQSAIAATAIFLSPARGFFAAITMPVVSQAVFELRWRGAAAVAIAGFASAIGVFSWAFGFGGLWRAAITYFPMYLFVVTFSVLGKKAVESRDNAERLSRDLREANEKLRAYAAEAEELATTRERNRVAREIHDGVGHYLTVIKVQLDAAAALLATDPPRAADSITKAARLAGEALDDVRRSVGTLAADATRPALVDSLRKLTADSEPAATLRIEGEPRLLTPAAEHALYRTAQEGLTNVRKHASATAATLTLDFRAPQRVRLAVVDNGRGVVPAPAANGNRYGLRGLRERIALLGGNVSAGDQPGGGFRLEVEVPA